MACTPWLHPRAARDSKASRPPGARACGGSTDTRHALPVQSPDHREKHTVTAAGPRDWAWRESKRSHERTARRAGAQRAARNGEPQRKGAMWKGRGPPRCPKAVVATASGYLPTPVRSPDRRENTRSPPPHNGPVAARQVLRRRDEQAAEVSHQQLLTAGADQRRDLPFALAGGTVLPLDQAAFLRIQKFYGTGENAVKT